MSWSVLFFAMKPTDSYGQVMLDLRMFPQQRTDDVRRVIVPKGVVPTRRRELEYVVGRFLGRSADVAEPEDFPVSFVFGRNLLRGLQIIPGILSRQVPSSHSNHREVMWLVWVDFFHHQEKACQNIECISLDWGPIDDAHLKNNDRSSQLFIFH